MTLRAFLLGVFSVIAFHVVILFCGAGSFIWKEAWLCLISFTIAGTSIAMWLKRQNANLLRGHLTFWKPNEHTQNKAIIIIGVLVYGAFLFIAGIDAVRWQYSDVPEVLKAIGFGMLVISYMISFRAIKENAFLTRTIDIQHERGQRVITTGPYSVVRHPLYAAGILSCVSLSIALGSLLGLLPAAGLAILLAIRITIEERRLRKGFEGYEEYARIVRYRLFPGLW